MANRSLRLPLSFDPARLLDDTERCLEQQWVDHFNRRDYEGEWTIVALRSASGGVTDILPVPGAGYQDTPLLARCPYFRAVLEQFDCQKETVRLMRLAAGSEILEHTDPGASYGDGFLRLHIPITTNPEVEFVVGGEDVTMRAGECWYADFTLPHRVRNRGTSDRIHLVVDGRRNAWSDGLFTRAGYDFTADTERRRPDPATTRGVIAELRARGTEMDLRLAADLERELAAEH